MAFNFLKRIFKGSKPAPKSASGSARPLSDQEKRIVEDAWKKSNRAKPAKK